jgi:hypothetical protein
MGRVDLVVIDHIGLTGFYPMKGVPDMKERINTWIKATTDLCKGFHENGFILVTLMYINAAHYIIGHRKYGDIISLMNKDLLKPTNSSLPEASSLFGSMVSV